MIEACSAHSGRPLVTPPVVQVQVAAALTGEQKPGVEPGRQPSSADRGPAGIGTARSERSASRIASPARRCRRGGRGATPPSSMSPRSSAIHSSGRSPVRPTTTGSAENVGRARHRPPQALRGWRTQEPPAASAPGSGRAWRRSRRAASPVPRSASTCRSALWIPHADRSGTSCAIRRSRASSRSMRRSRQPPYPSSAGPSVAYRSRALSVRIVFASALCCARYSSTSSPSVGIAVGA